MQRLGIDIGGTFTDVVLLDESSGGIVSQKVLTRRNNLAQSILEGITKILAEGKIQPKDVSMIAHGTTVGLNAILERKLPKTALVTTKGFRDVLEIRRGHRPPEYVYDIRRPMPEPFVPRRLRFEADERVNYSGEVLKDLNEKELGMVAKKIRENNVESIAVCLLFSYLFPYHEQKIKQILREEYPEAFITLSSEIHPEFREFDRTSVTVLNALVAPILTSYLDQLEKDLAKIGLATNLHIMQSNGGLTTSQTAKSRAFATLLSGPAAGVVAASHIASAIGLKDVISCDMGGTGFEVSLIKDSVPQITTEQEIAYMPLSAPVIDIFSIGAGGGSIAWIDGGGALRVGPRSAAAEPGPACYGLGGDLPTVTDADLVMGLLNPDYFLGGKMKLHPDKARASIKKRVADVLGMDVDEAAAGIYTIINASMAGAIRAVTVKRGFDPREYALIALGGAGPAHAAAFAKDLEVKWTVIPSNPGTGSAFGLVMSNIVHDFTQTYATEFADLDLRKTNEMVSRLEEKALKQLAAEKVPEAQKALIRSADLRYAGQTFSINVPFPPGRLHDASLRRLAQNFHKLHNLRYHFMSEDKGIELVNLRVTAIGKFRKSRLRKMKAERNRAEKALKGRREVFLGSRTGRRLCRVYDHSRLRPGYVVNGPAIIEHESSTIAVPEDVVCKMDEYFNLIMGKEEWKA